MNEANQHPPASDATTAEAKGSSVQRMVRQEWRDEAKNILFCCYLAECKVSDPRGYCWNDGDPLYRGHPISGRATAAENRAILKMKTEEETRKLLSA